MFLELGLIFNTLLLELWVAPRYGVGRLTSFALVPLCFIRSSEGAVVWLPG